MKFIRVKSALSVLKRLSIASRCRSPSGKPFTWWHICFAHLKRKKVWNVVYFAFIFHLLLIIYLPMLFLLSLCCSLVCAIASPLPWRIDLSSCVFFGFQPLNKSNTTICHNLETHSLSNESLQVRQILQISTCSRSQSVPREWYLCTSGLI